MVLDEREILLKEKYTSSAQEKYYVKPLEQMKVVTLNKKRTSMVGFFAKVLLPQGYPDSVSRDYISYQKWDTAQAFCSTIMAILATQEVLRGVGVGDKTATPLAATVTWVLKDGCGHLGRILFAYTHGSYLDSYSKKWRLFADTLNDAAMCIEIALPLFLSYTTFALCVSTVMKSIVGVAGGATRVAMTQHHAIRGNMGDVAAKDSAQETAVNLVASITALLIITLFGNSLFVFTLMMILHITFNYFAVRAVCLRTLNEPRFLQVIEMYLKREIISNPCDINRSEPIVFYHIGNNLLDLKMCGFQIKLGKSFAHVIEHLPEASHLTQIKEIYCKSQYIILPNTSKGVMYVFLKEKAAVDDILKGYFHAVLLASITRAILGDNIEMQPSGVESEQRPFARVCSVLQQAEISRLANNEPSLFQPPYELLSYVRNIAAREWPVVKMALLRLGWDLSKHLLVVDEWRICNEWKTEADSETDMTPTGTLTTPKNSTTHLRNSSSTPINATLSINLSDSEIFSTEPISPLSTHTVPPKRVSTKPSNLKHYDEFSTEPISSLSTRTVSTQSISTTPSNLKYHDESESSNLTDD